jgi:hypothetical protein
LVWWVDADEVVSVAAGLGVGVRVAGDGPRPGVAAADACLVFMGIVVQFGGASP